MSGPPKDGRWPVNKAAQALGRLGGKSTSEAKRRAARENWRKAAAALKSKRKAANDPSSPMAAESHGGAQPKESNGQ